jgi:hypothetical protein
VIAPLRVFLNAPLPHPVAKTCRLWLPLERLRRQTRQDFAPPFESPLMNFQIRRSTTLFVLSAPRPFSPTRATSPNAPFHSRLWKFTSEPGILLRASVMLHAKPPGPSMNPANRAAPR